MFPALKNLFLGKFPCLLFRGIYTQVYFRHRSAPTPYLYPQIAHVLKLTMLAETHEKYDGNGWR